MQNIKYLNNKTLQFLWRQPDKMERKKIPPALVCSFYMVMA